MAERTAKSWRFYDPPIWLAYGVSFAIVVGMALLRHALTPVLDTGYTYITFFAAVTIAAWFGGFGPGVFAGVLSSVIANYLYMEPLGELSIASRPNQVSLILFLLMSVLISSVLHFARRAARGAADAAERLAEAVHQHEQSEERVRLIVRNALDAVVAMDAEGNISGWNPSAERIFGWSAEEVIGRRLSEVLIPQRYRRAHEEGFDRFLKTGVGRIINNRVRLEALTKSGAEIPIELTVSLIQSRHGLSFSAFLRDITFESALDEARERLSTTLRSIGDAVIASDPNGLVTFMNPVAEDLTGWSAADAVGLPVETVFNIVSEETGETVESPHREVLREKKIVGLANHTELVARDGRRVPIEDSAAPIQSQSGEVLGVVLVFHDVSARKKREVEQKFLAEATEALSTSLDYQETLAKVAHLAVPMTADWCAVDMLDESGEVQRLAIAHVNPAKVEQVRQIQERYPTEPQSDYGIHHILKTGESEFMREIPTDLLVRLAKDEEHVRLIQELRLSSYIGVPIKAEGKVLGAISFVFAESGRHYDEHDLAFAQELAARAAIAIQNAKLFSSAAALNVELQERLSELERWFELSPIGLAISEDAECSTVRANPALKEMMQGQWQAVVTGSTPDGVRITRGGAAIATGDMPMERACLTRAEIEPEEIEAAFESGKVVTLMVYAAPLFAEDGSVRGSISAYVDITESRRRERQQMVVAQLGREALAGMDLDYVFDRACQELVSLLGTDTGSVLAQMPNSNELVLRVGYGWPADAVGTTRITLTPGSQMHYVRNAPGAVYYSDLESQDMFTPEPLMLRLGVKAGIAAPIYGEESVWGVLQTHSKRALQFSSEDASFVESVANVLGTAIERRRREEAVTKLASIIQSSDDGIISKDFNGTITNWNPGAERMYGYTAEEAIGQSINIVIPPERRAELPEIMGKLRRGEHIDHFETVRRRKDGTDIDVSVSIAPIRSASGDLVGASVIARDITERKITEEVQRQLMTAIEAERNRLTDIFRTVPGVVWEAWGQPSQEEQRIDFVSDYVEEAFGYSVEEWLAEPNFWLRIVHPEDQERAAAEAVAIFMKGGPGSSQFRCITKDGRTVWIHSFSTAIYDDSGNPAGMRGVMLDITQLKLAELAVAESEQRYRNLNEQLEQRVVERTQELTAANNELEAFSYSVSHDLRAPLRALDGFSRILMEDHADQLDGDARDYLERIRAASQRMGQLIEDLLNLAHVTRTEMHRENVDLSEMISSIAEELNSRGIYPKPTAYEVESGMNVVGDTNLLKAAMSNLLENAWKFSSKQEQPRVEAGMSKQDGRTVYFIRDNGAGFEQEYASKLFQPFQRLHSMSEYSGTGIGLATVHRILHRHGGRIWAEGEPGKGATFYFTLEEGRPAVRTRSKSSAADLQHS